MAGDGRSSGEGGRVRLAELVAALSLGIDLGFGQPMEHVLRQCLIALRLAERIGLDEEARATVYYTALLDQRRLPHRRARAGEVVRRRHRAQVHQVRPRVPGRRRCGGGAALLGAGNPPLHRFRLGLEFALSGRRELDGMVAHHADMARALAEQLELPDDVLESLGKAYEQWDGRGWPGELAGDERPARGDGSRRWPSSSRSRTASAAPTRRRRSPARRSGSQFDPQLAAIVCDAGRDDPRRPRLGRDVGGGDRRRAGARGDAHRRPVRRRRCSRSRTSST